MADQSRQIKLAAAKKKVKCFLIEVAYYQGKHQFTLSFVGLCFLRLVLNSFMERGCCHYTSSDTCAVARTAFLAHLRDSVSRRNGGFVQASAYSINFPRLC